MSVIGLRVKVKDVFPDYTHVFFMFDEFPLGMSRVISF